MAAAALTEQRALSVVECPICVAPYTHEGDNVPLVLKECGHTFCRLCLIRLEGNTSIACPLCRKETPCNSADLYPAYSLLEYMAAVTLERQKAEQQTVTPPKCEQCKTVDSSFSCLDCAVTLCVACNDSVHQLGLLKQHRRNTWTSGQDSSIDRCPNHKDFPLNLVCLEASCSQKDGLICLFCKEYGPVHKGHKADLVSNVVAEHKTILQEFKKLLQNSLNVVTAAASKVAETATKITGRDANTAAKVTDARGGAAAKARESIQAAFVRQRERLNQQEQELLQRVTEIEASKVKALENQSTSLAKYLSKIFAVLGSIDKHLQISDDRLFMSDLKNAGIALEDMSKLMEESKLVLKPVMSSEIPVNTFLNAKSASSGISFSRPNEDSISRCVMVVDDTGGVESTQVLVSAELWESFYRKVLKKQPQPVDEPRRRVVNFL